MDVLDFSQQSLPSPRTDIEVLPGGTFGDASPRWLLFDHVSDEYFELDTLSARIYKALAESPSFGQLLATIQRFDRFFSAEALNETLTFFAKEKLLSDSDARVRNLKQNDLGTGSSSLFSKVLHNYLFVKVPLLSPEPWIGKVAERLRWMRSRPVLALRLVLLVYCVSVLVTRFNELKGTFIDHISLGWLVLTVLGIAFFKVVHEFAHAVAAKWEGVRVSQLGMAFLVLFPILYTDATDAWRIEDPRRRRRIAMAGVTAELQVAAVALVAWSLLPEGWARSLCFVLFLSGLIPSVLVNLNPLMRFDAYFWLSDKWGITNLQARAFEIGRAWMRHGLFGLPMAFNGLTRSKELKLALFSYAVWIYRFFLFLGIALLVYSIDFKLLGIFLFVVEIWVFIARPVVREAQHLFRQKGAVQLTPLGLVLLLAIGILGMWAAAPSTETVRVQAVLKPVSERVFVADQSGELVALRPNTERVQPGDWLFEIRHPGRQIASAEADLDLAINQSRYDAARRGELADQLESIRERVDSLKIRADELKRLAQASGVQARSSGIWTPSAALQRNDRVAPGQEVGQLIDDSGSQIVAYVSESTQIAPDATFRFVTDTRVLLQGRARVVISPAAERGLSSPLLASSMGGQLAATRNESTQQWQLVTPMRRIVLTLDAPFEWRTHVRGVLTIEGQAPSRLRSWSGKLINDLRGEAQW